MSGSERDIIDQIGRALVVAVLVYVTTYAIGYLLSVLNMSLRPVYGLLLATGLVSGSLYLYYNLYTEEETQ